MVMGGDSCSEGHGFKSPWCCTEGKIVTGARIRTQNISRSSVSSNNNESKRICSQVFLLCSSHSRNDNIIPTQTSSERRFETKNENWNE